LISQPSAGARVRAGTGVVNLAERSAGQVRPGPGPAIGPLAFAGFAVASFGGPLALAALSAPGTLDDAAGSAGLAMLAAVAVFAFPLVIWLRYARHINSSGGLYAFVEAAAGRRVALAQAAIWTFSYLLYIVYTTVQIVYDLLPAIFPGERHYQSLLALLIPIAVAGVMIAGRAAALIVIGVIAAGQLVLAGILDGVTVANLSTPISSFGISSSAGSVAQASAQTSLLYICGSLPLFLSGEVASPRTVRRGLTGAFLISGLVILLAVAPLAAAPGLTHADVPGVTVMQLFSTRGLAHAVGIGIAASTAGVIICEYFALSRLAHAIGGWRMRPVNVLIGAVLVLSAPFTLIDPEGFYDTLLKPSLIALWLSQLIVFAVYPLFAAKHRARMLPAWMFTVVASGLAIYGLWTTLHQAAT
jgi:fumarate reductase subunit D